MERITNKLLRRRDSLYWFRRAFEDDLPWVIGQMPDPEAPIKERSTVRSWSRASAQFFGTFGVVFLLLTSVRETSKFNASYITDNLSINKAMENLPRPSLLDERYLKEVIYERYLRLVPPFYP